MITDCAEGMSSRIASRVHFRRLCRAVRSVLAKVLAADARKGRGHTELQGCVTRLCAGPHVPSYAMTWSLRRETSRQDNSAAKSNLRTAEANP